MDLLFVGTRKTTALVGGTTMTPGQIKGVKLVPEFVRIMAKDPTAYQIRTAYDKMDKAELDMLEAEFGREETKKMFYSEIPAVKEKHQKAEEERAEANAKVQAKLDKENKAKLEQEEEDKLRLAEKKAKQEAEKAEADKDKPIDFEAMTRAEIMDFAKTEELEIDEDMSRMNKADMIALVQEAYAGTLIGDE